MIASQLQIFDYVQCCRELQERLKYKPEAKP